MLDALLCYAILCYAMLCYAMLCYTGQSNSRSDSERCPPLAQTPIPMPKLFHSIIMALLLCFCASSFNLVFPVFLHLCLTSTDTILNSVLERSIIHNTQCNTEKVYNTLMYLCPLLACRPISSSSPSRADNPPWTERTHGLTGLEIKVMPSLSSLLPVYYHVLLQ